MKTLIYILSVLFCGTSLAQVSSSKDTLFTIEEINVISNKIETNIFWSPTSVNLIDSKQINSANGERLSDVLKSSGNIFLKSYGGNASLNTVSLNGLGAEHTLILIDGVNMNSFQNSQADLSLFPKDKIEKIEIMNNGASSIYGSNAIGGVINIITKNPDKDNPHIDISGAYGSYKYAKFSANVSNSVGKINYDLFYSHEKSRDDFNYLYDDGIKEIEKQREKNSFYLNNLYLNLSAKINEKIRLGFNSNYVSQNRNLPGTENGTPVASALQIDENWNNNLSVKINLKNDFFVSSVLNFRNNLMKYKDILSNDYFKNRVISNNSSFGINFNNVKIISGIEILYSDLNTLNYRNMASRNQYSLYTSAEYNFKDKLKFYPSARYDFISDINTGVFTSKFGINYKPFEKLNLNLRSSVGNNFSAPTFNELYWINSGNTGLRPEKSLNYEAGLILNFFAFADNSLELNYTGITLEDKIVWKPAGGGLWKPCNIDKSKSDIFSMSFKIKKNVSKDFMLGLYYSYVYNKSTKMSEDYPGDPSLGKQIFYVPLEMSKLNFDLNYKDFGLNLYYSFTGKRYSDFENLQRLPVIDLLNGNVSYSFKIVTLKMNAKLEVDNILNEDYQVITGYPMPLRNYKFILNISY